MTFDEELICAVVTPVGPGHDIIFDECTASVKAARENNAGAFNKIEHLRIDDPLGKYGAGKARDVGSREAISLGSDWIFFLDADDVMTPNAFELITPYLDTYDAVWGAVCRLPVGRDNALIEHTAVPVCQNLYSIFNEGLDVCLTESHFMRASKATSVPFESGDKGTDFLHHAFATWRDHRCVKISRPFAVRREGKASDNTRHLSADTRAEAVRGMVTDWTFKTRPVVSFSHQSEDFRFRFNGANKYQERAWLDGKFWEAEELDYLTAVLPPHPAVIDVGANVGNHAVYFARFLAPSNLRLFEPHPEAVEVLKDNLKLNGVSNVDIEEVAVSKIVGRGSLRAPKNKGHGAASLYKNDTGNIVVTTLDQWSDRAIDLVKIDVEGGELDVLLGGKNLLKNHRPHLLVEISDERFCEIKYILSELDYEVGAVFPYFGISNVHFSPQGKNSER